MSKHLSIEASRKLHELGAWNNRPFEIGDKFVPSLDDLIAELERLCSMPDHYRRPHFDEWWEIGENAAGDPQLQIRCSACDAHVKTNVMDPFDDADHREGFGDDYREAAAACLREVLTRAKEGDHA